MKVFKTIVIAIPILFVLWIVGMFNGLKLVPVFHEDYYTGDHGLDRQMMLMQPNEDLALQIPALYNDTMAVDLLIFPAYGQDHILSVNKLSAKVIADGKALDTLHFYVYNSEGLQRDLSSLANDSASTYIQARYVYDLTNLDKFIIDVDAEYIYNDTLRQFKKTFEVDHTKKLQWRGMNLGGKY